MSMFRTIWCALALACGVTTMASIPASAQQQQQQPQGQKPNILFIMGDDIGWMQPSIYHRGLMVGETPNIDRIGNEGAIFMDYVAMQSCTSGRNAFFTGMYPLRTGMIPPQLPGSPSYLRPGTPALAQFLYDPASGELTYVNAGHNAPVLRRANLTMEFLDKGGLPLGIVSSAAYETGTVSLHAGDTLVMFTDGVVEAFNATGEEYGNGRWLNAIRNLPSGAASQSLQFLMRGVDEFVGATRQSDDITCLVFQCK